MTTVMLTCGEKKRSLKTPARKAPVHQAPAAVDYKRLGQVHRVVTVPERHPCPATCHKLTDQRYKSMAPKALSSSNARPLDYLQ